MVSLVDSVKIGDNVRVRGSIQHGAASISWWQQAVGDSNLVRRNITEIMGRQMVACVFCHKSMYKYNMQRHMASRHKELGDGGFLHQSEPPSAPNTRDQSPAMLARGVRETSQILSSEELHYHIQGAVECMLRREVRNDVKTLNAYLAGRFPDIPAEFRDPIIFATFKTARKVAATHIDALLPDTDNRSVWAKRALARWAHGLSYPEPAPPYVDGELSNKPSNSDECSPLNNTMMNKELPVPFDSEIQRREAKRDFDEATHQIVETATKSNDEVLSRPTVDNAVSAVLETVAMQLISSAMEQCVDESKGTTSESVSHVTCAAGAPVLAKTSSQHDEWLDLAAAPVMKTVPQESIAAVPSVRSMPIIIPDGMSDVEPDDEPPQESSVAVMSNPAKRDEEIQSTPLKAPEEGEIVESPSSELTFNKLLKFETDDPDLAEMLGQPLGELITPIATPFKKPESVQAVPVAEKSDERKVQLKKEATDTKRTFHMEKAVNGDSVHHSRLKSVVTKGTKKPRLDRPSKENGNPAGANDYKQDSCMKRKLPNPGAKSRPVAWQEQRDCSRPRSSVAGRPTMANEGSDNYRFPVPDFKVPLKSRQITDDHRPGYRPRSPYRGEEHGRFGGFGRGYRPYHRPGRGRGQPRALPFSRPEGVPGFNTEQERWLDDMNPHVVPKFTKEQQRWLDQMMPAWANRR